MRFLLERFRFIAVIAVIGLAVTAAATFGWSVAKSVKFVNDLLTGDWRDELMVVNLLQVIDTYLLAVVQVIIVLGIYELFVSDLDVPSWLDVHSLDDLKKPIVDVLVVYVGVKGVEALVKTPDSTDALRFAAAVGIIILALTGFRLAKSAGKRGADPS